MSQPTHTLEPWEVDNVNFPVDIYASPDKDHTGPTLIAQTKNVDYPYQMATANAARIVACVNGCAGLNPAAYRECVEALRTVKHALEEWVTTRTLAVAFRPAMSSIESAIAAAEGGRQP